jgi:hypothetical protein
MSNHKNRLRQRRDRGALLGIVLILLVVIVSASAYAMWALRSDTGAAGQDRLTRQLFDCAERGLAAGKNYFAVTARNNWSLYLAANVCTSGTLPCAPSGPFPTGNTGGVPNYPTGFPFTAPMEPSGTLSTFSYTFGIYQNPSTEVSRIADTDNTVIVYASCTDSLSKQSRAVQAVLKSPPAPPVSDYTGQAGMGMRNGNNAN